MTSPEAQPSGRDRSGITVTSSADVVDDPDLLGEVVPMLVAASKDAELCDNTYLPPNLQTAEAHTWLEGRDHAYMIIDDSEPVGWFEVEELSDHYGIELPDHTHEVEFWLLPSARGRGILASATAQLSDELARRGVTHLVGIAWEDNDASIRSMRRNGYEHAGRVWWEPGELHGDSRAGWCQIWLLSVADANSAQADRHKG